MFLYRKSDSRCVNADHITEFNISVSGNTCYLIATVGNSDEHDDFIIGEYGCRDFAIDDMTYLAAIINCKDAGMINDWNHSGSNDITRPVAII